MSNPLQAYEEVFASLQDETTAFRRADEKVALRFPDPLGRRDSSGRVIPHEFVVLEDLAGGIQTVETGFQQVWPRVAGAYARIWDTELPPSVAYLRFGA